MSKAKLRRSVEKLYAALDEIAALKRDPTTLQLLAEIRDRADDISQALD
jgi:hypothetical protein